MIFILNTHMIPIFVGYDKSESVCYHVAVHSMTRRSTMPLSITPLNIDNLTDYQESHNDSSNSSSYTRFLVPYLMNYQGWAIYTDCDIVLQDNIVNLWNFRDQSKAILCAQHNYQTKSSVKFLNSKNSNYPKKNWSSVMLINCAHPANKILDPKLIESSSGSYLHQFQWIDQTLIGSLPLEWNWLVGEYPENNQAKLLHYTLGAPCFSEYRNCEMSDVWHNELKVLLEL